MAVIKYHPPNPLQNEKMKKNNSSNAKNLPYSPAFTGMPLYTKPPIFEDGQVVSDISACRTLFGDYGMSYYLRLFRKPCQSILGQNITKNAVFAFEGPENAKKLKYKKSVACDTRFWP